MQNFCTNCGNKLNEADKFCSSCGKASNHNNYDITCVNCGYGLAEAKVLCPNCNKSPYEIVEDNSSVKLNHSKIFDIGKVILGIFFGMIIFTVLSLLISSIPEIINPEPDAGCISNKSYRLIKTDENNNSVLMVFTFSRNRTVSLFTNKVNEDGIRRIKSKSGNYELLGNEDSSNTVSITLENQPSFKATFNNSCDIVTYLGEDYEKISIKSSNNDSPCLPFDRNFIANQLHQQEKLVQAITPVSGRIYIVEYYNNRTRRIEIQLLDYSNYPC